jgi:protein-tyrosine phosphatase
MTEIISEFLYLGNMNDALNTEWLNKNKIKNILNVAKEVDIKQKKYNYLHLHLDDYNFNNKFKSEYPKAIKFIDDALKRKEKILVHCRAGMNRSATIVILYLFKRCNMDLEKAHLYVKMKRFIINPILLRAVKNDI